MTTRAEPKTPIPVSLVASDPALRAALAQTLRRAGDLRCVGSHSTTREALTELPRLRPRIVVLEADLRGTTPSESVRAFRALSPELELLILGASSMTGEAVWHWLRAGADGVCVMERGMTSVPNGIRALAAGRFYLCPSAQAVLAGLARRRTPGPTAPGLGHADLPVLEALAAHPKLSEKELADRLGMSPRTFYWHIQRIQQKTGAHGRAEIVRWWLGLA